MDVRWQVQEAKQRFSEVLNRALVDGPQVITRHGKEVAILIDIEQYRQLSGHDLDFKGYLFGGPKTDDLVVERSTDLAPLVELDLMPDT